MLGYLRLFSILSFLSIIVIAILGGMSFRSMAVNDLTYLEEKSDTRLAQGYINAVWKKYREVLVPLAAGDPAALRSNPQVLQFAGDTVHYFEQMPLVRVNVYSADGKLLLTVNVNPSDKLFARDASPDTDFIAAQMKSGQTSTSIVHDVPLQSGNAALMQTLVPIRADSGAREGAIELLSDISLPWTEVVHFQWYGTGGIIVIFLIFLGVLSLTSKKAEAIIAKQHETNLELAAAASAAQAENQQKSQFLANISHELRTPLNAIIGFSDILKTEVMPLMPERKYDEYVNDIYSSGVHLLSLINDILDYSKAEAGKLELEVAEVNAHKIVQNCLRLVGPRAESGNVQLRESLPKEPFIMVTDSKKFRQILLNLLSNAVKFTPAGGEVAVAGWHNVTDDTISFEVRDSGIGIAPKDISRAMAPFGQVDNTLKRKYEGTGLGLPLTKKFVELMGGKFIIESQVGAGTTITFTVPREIKPREGLIIKQETASE